MAFRYLACGVFLLGSVLLGACERPFVDPVPPTVTVVAPDLSTVQDDAALEVRIEASSFRPIDRVELNGQLMDRDTLANEWMREVVLAPGLNTLVITAYDVADVTHSDTVYAVHLPARFTAGGPTLPEPRGGHTATQLTDGSLLVTGGATCHMCQARNDAFLLQPGDTAFEILPSHLHVARTGHTATLLPDGRVLILGGSRTENIQSIDDLVEQVEIYDPATRQFSPLVFTGQPIRRAFHTALLRQEDGSSIVYLYGGRGDIRYTPDPRLGVRRDLRTFRFTGNLVEALTSLQGSPYLGTAIWGHTLSPLGMLDPAFEDQFAIHGTYFDEQQVDDASFIIDFSSPFGLLTPDVPPIPTPRTRHAAAPLGELLGLFGGYQNERGTALAGAELYSPRANHYFHLPPHDGPRKRFGHTATNLSSQRILLLGGFSESGTAFTDSELFDVRFAE